MAVCHAHSELLPDARSVSTVQVCRLSCVLHSDAPHPCLGEDLDKDVRVRRDLERQRHCLACEPHEVNIDAFRPTSLLIIHSDSGYLVHRDALNQNAEVGGGENVHRCAEVETADVAQLRPLSQGKLPGYQSHSLAEGASRSRRRVAEEHQTVAAPLPNVGRELPSVALPPGTGKAARFGRNILPDFQETGSFK